MNDLKQLAAMTALNNMMLKHYFDICAVDSAAKLLNVNRGGDAYDILHALHCVHWEKIPVELRDSIPDLIHKCLGVAPTYQFKSLAQEVLDLTPTKRLLQILGRKSKP